MPSKKKPATKRQKSNLLRKMSVPANRDLHEHVSAAAAAAGMTISTYIKMAMYRSISAPIVVAIEHKLV